MEHLYHFDDYRDAIAELIEAQKRKFSKLTYQKVAEGCRIQKSYLTRVLKKKADLSRDQLYLVCETLFVDEFGRKFLFMLHDLNRCSVESRKMMIHAELIEFRRNYLKTESHINPDEVVSNFSGELSTYYLDLDAQLLHQFLSLDKSLTMTQIASQMNLDMEDIQTLLGKLERYGLIVIHSNADIRVTKKDLHLSANHPVYLVYRTLMRAKMMMKSPSKGSGDDYSYSAFFTASSDAREIIKKKFNLFLKEIQLETQKTPSEGVFQFNLDITKWSS